MINGQTILAIIPARGGSKGVPRKNLRLVGGKPLIAWTIEAARASRHLDRLVLSSDDQEIIAAARESGCEAPFVRPAHLATDEAGAMDVIRHCLASLPEAYDLVMLLQPTSPFRDTSDIDAAIELMARTNAPACVSMTAVAKPPQWMFHVSRDSQITPFINEKEKEEAAKRRQELPPLHVLNGAIYLARTEWLLARESFISPETVAYPMPAERSLDIDTEFDLGLAEFFSNKR